MFTYNAGRIQVRIEDDGVGFDVARFFKVEGQGFGLHSMRDRAEAIGGTFQILSAPGRGTRVIAEIPCESASADLRWSEHGKPQTGASREYRGPTTVTARFHQSDYENPFS
ncbi:MAG: sensor histidine kinase [Hyphomicrobiales bacterium]